MGKKIVKVILEFLSKDEIRPMILSMLIAHIIITHKIPNIFEIYIFCFVVLSMKTLLNYCNFSISVIIQQVLLPAFANFLFMTVITFITVCCIHYRDGFGVLMCAWVTVIIIIISLEDWMPFLSSCSGIIFLSIFFRSGTIIYMIITMVLCLISYIRSEFELSELKKK